MFFEFRPADVKRYGTRNETGETTLARGEQVVRIIPSVEGDMAKKEDVVTDIDKMMGHLISLIGTAQVEQIQAGVDKRFDAVVVKTVTGRKYNQVVLNFEKNGKTKLTEVRYFVDRITGDIYGAKSPVAPNERQFYGNIENADKWDWSGERAVNVADETVEEAGRYGKFIHYRPVSRRRRKTAATV